MLLRSSSSRTPVQGDGERTNSVSTRRARPRRSSTFNFGACGNGEEGELQKAQTSLARKFTSTPHESARIHEIFALRRKSQAAAYVLRTTATSPAFLSSTSNSHLSGQRAGLGVGVPGGACLRRAWASLMRRRRLARIISSEASKAPSGRPKSSPPALSFRIEASFSICWSCSRAALTLFCAS